MQQVLLGRRGRKQKYIPALALSLLDLRYSVVPFVVQIERYSDNISRDFTALEVVNGTLENWVGSGNGGCRIWYDQLGNFDFIQLNPDHQPHLVTDGVLNLLNGNPVLRVVNNATTMYNTVYGVQDFKAVCVSSITNVSARPTSALFSDYINRSNFTFYASSGSNLTSTYNGGVINDERIDGDVFNYTTRDELHQAFSNKQRILSFTASLTFRRNGRALGYSPTDRPSPMYDMQELLIYPQTFGDIEKVEEIVKKKYNIN